MDTIAHFRMQLARTAFLIGVFCVSTTWVSAVNKMPPELKSARKSYEDEFFRKLASIQGKYQRALEQYQRDFTRSGNLDAAKEAQQEIQLAEHWETIPVKAGRRSMKDPKLNSLLQNYERACEKVMTPITDRYEQSLERLKKGFSQTGNLEASLLVETELSKLTQGKGHPAEKGGLRFLENLTKGEFAEWLEEQSFEFTGAISGITKLKFEKGKVRYGTGTIYDYKVTKTRTVEIIKGGRAAGFIIEFSNDLQSAMLQSVRGKYPVRINGKEPVVEN